MNPFIEATLEERFCPETLVIVPVVWSGMVFIGYWTLVQLLKRLANWQISNKQFWIGYAISLLLMWLLWISGALSSNF